MFTKKELQMLYDLVECEIIELETAKANLDNDDIVDEAINKLEVISGKLEKLLMALKG